MITAQPQHCWHRYKKAQPRVPEFLLSTAEKIYNPVFGQNFRTWHIIYTLTSLVPRPLRKGMTLTHKWKRTSFASPLSNKIQESGVLLLLLYQAQPKPWEEIRHPFHYFRDALSTPTPCQGRRAPCHHTAALCPHISQRKTCRFFSPLPRYPRAFMLIAEQPGLSETTSH